MTLFIQDNLFHQGFLERSEQNLEPFLKFMAATNLGLNEEGRDGEGEVILYEPQDELITTVSKVPKPKKGIEG
jgi:hypothetical protein